MVLSSAFGISSSFLLLKSKFLEWLNEPKARINLHPHSDNIFLRNTVSDLFCFAFFLKLQPSHQKQQHFL
jgi:hypothetical protein